MNVKHVLIILLAALLLPGLAVAQTSRATFHVYKDFTDDNTALVKMTLNCFTGLPLTQSQWIHAGVNNAVTFVVTDFVSGALDCTVTEDELDGYTADYGNCGTKGKFTEVTDGAALDCGIFNATDPVQIEITKNWVIDGEGGNPVSGGYEIDLKCYYVGGMGTSDTNDTPYCNKGTCSVTFYSDNKGPEDGDTETYTAAVIPDWDGDTYCYANEYAYDSSVEVDDSDCGNFAVDIGDADDADGCTITNTVFFEGIPTLSQYGMAIMALLMLGVGFVGFRRLV